MSEKTRGLFVLVAAVALSTAAYFGARYWQSSQSDYTRVEAQHLCDLRAGPCREPVPGGGVVFAIAPESIPLMKPLRLIVSAQGLEPTAVVVEIRGLNMEMGLNRTVLNKSADGMWEGETILPVCSQKRMEWEAAVLLEANQRLEVPFAFHTVRP